jgi:hypothetical protein
MTTIRSGFTGPSKKIGGSTDYHIDLKLLNSLPLAERVKVFDTLAERYGQNKRNIEFSNPGVSGNIYNPNVPFSERAALLQRAAGAHAPSSASFSSYDFYVPFQGQSRFKKGAVEDASIYIPTVAGGSVKRGSGGGYGYYSEALDPSGKVLYRVGHGNVDRPEKDGGLLVPKVPELPSSESQIALDQRQQDQLAGAGAALGLMSRLFGQARKSKDSSQSLYSSLIGNALRQQQQDPASDFLMSYIMQPSSYGV